MHKRSRVLRMRDESMERKMAKTGVESTVKNELRCFWLKSEIPVEVRILCPERMEMMYQNIRGQARQRRSGNSAFAPFDHNEVFRGRVSPHPTDKHQFKPKCQKAPYGIQTKFTNKAALLARISTGDPQSCTILHQDYQHWTQHTSVFIGTFDHAWRFRVSQDDNPANQQPCPSACFVLHPSPQCPSSRRERCYSLSKFRVYLKFRGICKLSCVSSQLARSRPASCPTSTLRIVSAYIDAGRVDHWVKTLSTPRPSLIGLPIELLAIVRKLVTLLAPLFSYLFGLAQASPTYAIDCSRTSKACIMTLLWNLHDTGNSFNLIDVDVGD
ncbi:hypothetical protein C8R43DRAFT_958801 [Mycena crocata]|nr:hypothetical protein C8R43DRAFT_958801 [Mycena crocata]